MAEPSKDSSQTGEQQSSSRPTYTAIIPDRCTVDIATLSVQQLSQVKKQLDEELEHLTSSFAKLRAAQSRFQECLKSIDKGVSSLDEGTDSDNPLH